MKITLIFEVVTQVILRESTIDDSLRAFGSAAGLFFQFMFCYCTPIQDLVNAVSYIWPSVNSFTNFTMFIGQVWGNSSKSLLERVVYESGWLQGHTPPDGQSIAKSLCKRWWYYGYWSPMWTSCKYLQLHISYKRCPTTSWLSSISKNLQLTIVKYSSYKKFEEGPISTIRKIRFTFQLQIFFFKWDNWLKNRVICNSTYTLLILRNIKYSSPKI